MTTINAGHASGPRTFLFLDVGGTTGFALWDCADGTAHLATMGHLTSFEALIHLLSQLASPDVVVYENFITFFAPNLAQRKTLKLCGAVEALAVLKGFSVASQQPSERTAYIPQAKAIVKEKGYTAKEMHHAIDALAHSLAYFAKEGISYDYTKI